MNESKQFEVTSTHEQKVFDLVVAVLLEQHVVDVKVGVVQHIVAEFAFVESICLQNLAQVVFAVCLEAFSVFLVSVPFLQDLGEDRETSTQKHFSGGWVIEDASVEVSWVDFLWLERRMNLEGS
jgi:hypothetical protein